VATSAGERRVDILSKLAPHTRGEHVAGLRAALRGEPSSLPTLVSELLANGRWRQFAWPGLARRSPRRSPTASFRSRATSLTQGVGSRRRGTLAAPATRSNSHARVVRRPEQRREAGRRVEACQHSQSSAAEWQSPRSASILDPCRHARPPVADGLLSRSARAAAPSGRSQRTPRRRRERAPTSARGQPWRAPRRGAQRARRRALAAAGDLRSSWTEHERSLPRRATSRSQLVAPWRLRRSARARWHAAPRLLLDRWGASAGDPAAQRRWRATRSGGP
jgi:hypothetical protein